MLVVLLYILHGRVELQRTGGRGDNAHATENGYGVLSVKMSGCGVARLRNVAILNAAVPMQLQMHARCPRGRWYTYRCSTIHLVEFGTAKRDCTGSDRKHGRGDTRGIVGHMLGGRVVLVLHGMHLHGGRENVLLVVGSSDCNEERVTDAGTGGGNGHAVRL